MKNITVKEFIEELTQFAEANDLMDAEVISIGTGCGDFNGIRNPYTIRLQNTKVSRVAYIHSRMPLQKKSYTFADVAEGEKFFYRNQPYMKIHPKYIAGEKDPRIGIDEPGYWINAVGEWGTETEFSKDTVVKKYQKVI